MARQVSGASLRDLREEVCHRGIDQKFASLQGLIDAELLLRDGSTTFWINESGKTTTFVAASKDKSVGYTFYSTDEDDLRTVLLQVVDWQDRIRFMAPAEWFPFLDNLVQEQVPHFELDFHIVGDCLSVTEDTLVMHPIPEGYTMGELRPCDAREVNDCWPLSQGEASLRAVESQIRNFPSACVRDSKGRLAAFELCSPMLSLTNLFTYPEHRGRRLAAAVTAELSRKVIKLRGMGFLHVELTNHTSAAIQRKCGYSVMEGGRSCLALFVPGGLDCCRAD